MADSQKIQAQGANGVGPSGTSAPAVKWDDSDMKTSYANVVNAASTREEVALFFGTNQTWNVTDSQEFSVLLSNRIVLNPLAAKRLWMVLGGVLKDYEDRFGTLAVGRNSGAADGPGGG